MKKKIVLSVIVSVLLLGGSIPVLANNHTDTRWDFWLKIHQGNSYTPPRDKTDASSAYLQLTSLSRGTGVIGWLQMYNGEEIGSPKTFVKINNWKYVYNYAYERHGYSSVRMAIEAGEYYDVPVNAGGYWSPDSV